ncbi:putative receptor-like protein kinase [Hordeum vulgare]|nr:putative receptor-like protein kinase [Hordeum vulgare]
MPSSTLASLGFHVWAASLLTLAAGIRFTTAVTGDDQPSCYARDATDTVKTYIPCVAPSCTAFDNYTTGSAYERSLLSLLSEVPANVARGGFFKGTAGSGSEDMVFVLATCQADLPPAECQRCLRSASINLTRYCPHSKKVMAAYVGCMLHYAGQSFFGVAATGLLFYDHIAEADILDRDQEAFSRVRAALFDALRGAAAASPTLAAGGNLTYNGTHRLYGLSQCTGDLAGGECSRCLVDLAAYLRRRVHSLDRQTSRGRRERRRKLTVAILGNRIQNTGVVIAIVLGIVVIFLSILVVYLWRKARATQYAEEDDDAGSLLFDLPTLRKATGDFAEKNKLGHGGFGAVYKGSLSNGREIAVKRLDKASNQGIQQLRNELILVAKLRHNNLAKLLGVCLKGQEKLLVYEYMPNRSLDTFLFEAGRRELLDWGARQNIIHGTARGLLYLHEDSQIKILHRDLKASNILLDASMIPKISDFGLARLFSGDKTTSMTSQVVGTLGYMAPEYAVLGHLSVKLEVYSFGVLVLEIVSGRRSTDLLESMEHEEESNTLLSYVWSNWSRGTLLEVMDPTLDGEAPESETLRCIHIALLCVQANPADRPTMLDVLVMLHGEVSDFPAPTKPAFTFSQSEMMMSSGGLDSHGELVISVNEMSRSEFQPTK